MSNCQCFELNIINYAIQICLHFGNQNLPCHLNSWWTSFTHLFTIVFILKPEECFNFCGVMCWLLVVTTGLDVAWRNYQITWIIFPRENPELCYKVGNKAGKFKTQSLQQCLLWYILQWFFCSTNYGAFYWLKHQILCCILDYYMISDKPVKVSGYSWCRITNTQHRALCELIS